jgi:hypothetical protein
MMSIIVVVILIYPRCKPVDPSCYSACYRWKNGNLSISRSESGKWRPIVLEQLIVLQSIKKFIASVELGKPVGEGLVIRYLI